MSNATELARHEERAQHGIIEFAEEMQTIRDDDLYPGAETDSGNVQAAWKAYCDERWGMSKRVVDETIQALPVLRRLASAAGTRQLPSVSAAARVASLPERVQDVILGESPQRNDASDKAKAVRDAITKAARQGVELDVDEQVEVAKTFKPKAKKKKPKGIKDSRFITLASPALHFIEEAADYAEANVLSDTENDWAWVLIEKFRYHTDRIAERLHQPPHAKDLDAEFAKILDGGEQA